MKIKIEAGQTYKATSVFHVFCPACGHDAFHYPYGDRFRRGTLYDAYYRALQMYQDHLSFDRCPVADLIDARYP